MQEFLLLLSQITLSNAIPYTVCQTVYKKFEIPLDFVAVFVASWHFSSLFFHFEYQGVLPLAHNYYSRPQQWGLSPKDS